jgi:hypothetical protein
MRAVFLRWPMNTKQPSLFGQPDQYGSLSPRMSEAKGEGAEGMARVDAAQDGDFRARAERFVLDYLRFFGPKSGEDITDAAIKAGIVPTDLRAFGPIYMGLARSGRIVKDGYCQRRRGHGTSGGVIWRLA